VAQLVVSGFPLFTVAGAAHGFTVAAEDQYGNRSTAFTDTIRVAGQSYTFMPRDKGAHVFTTALPSQGTATLTATDTTNPSIPTGSERNIIVVGAPVALTPDPGNSTENALVIIAPPGGGTIIITPANSTGTAVGVTINGKTQPVPPSSTPLGHILVYCQSGAMVVKEVSTIIGTGPRVFVAIPAIILGGSGGNSISVAGSSADNILVGGPGRDTLAGGSGRDILIGAGGADILRAGTGDDILIGGSTVYNANLAALIALMSEWGRDDNTSYQQRVADLFNGGGLNGDYLLDAQTVLRDSAVNQFFGGSGRDWFWLSKSGTAMDVVGGYTAGAVATFDCFSPRKSSSPAERTPVLAVIKADEN
jgi:Ca2+-binding RTX toxin-like protein